VKKLSELGEVVVLRILSKDKAVVLDHSGDFWMVILESFWKGMKVGWTIDLGEDLYKGKEAIIVKGQDPK